MEQKLDEVHKAIIGNGRPGLLDRMTVVEQVQVSCPARKWSQPAVACAVMSLAIAGGALLMQLMR